MVSAVSEALGQLERPKCHEQVLRHLSTELSAAHGLVARHQSGRFEVLASIGVSPPSGTRLPMRGPIAATSKLPARLLLLPHPPSSVWCIGRPLSFELFLPLAVAGQVGGLLALAGELGNPTPSADYVATLEVIGPLLGSALLSIPTARQRMTERDRQKLAGLTARETEVLSLLPRGMTNSDIADALGMATGTAKIHVERILRKLNLQDRTQAAAKAVEWKVGSSE